MPTAAENPSATATVGGATGSQVELPKPPPGVDVGAFYNLVRSRQGGFIDNILAIDKAENNSSIVFCLK
jgi:hypothetical protein